ncbi:MAG: regulator of cell morphoproteinis and NO [Gallionellaceae bacterium]|nr:MAG: regulator of cell morphoproteinis and NO [Gallionellaceae bacterium]
MNNSTAQLNIEPDAHWKTSTLTELVAHLLRHHHPYTKNALEELAPLLDKVVRVHGDSHPELHELHKLFSELRDDMGMGALKNQVQHFWEKMLHGKNIQAVEC